MKKNYDPIHRLKVVRFLIEKKKKKKMLWR